MFKCFKIGSLVSLMLLVMGQRDLRADPPQSSATETLLQAAPEVIMARVLDQVTHAFGEYGTDYLQNLLRFYAENKIDLNQLRATVLGSNAGRPLSISIAASVGEIELANRVMAESGFDCFEFVAGSERVEEVESTARSIFRKWGEPALVFGAAVTAGILQVHFQQSRAAETGMPVGDFMSQLRPFLGMGIVGSLWTWQFEQFREWWKAHFWNSWPTPWKRELSLASLKDLGRRLLRPRGAYAETLKDLLTPLVLSFTASSVAAYPGNPVMFDAPSVPKMLWLMTLYTFSYGATRVALSTYQRRGAIAEGPKVFYESLVGSFARLALVASIVPVTSTAGQVTQTLLAVFSSGRLWLKLQIADPLFRRRTANLLDPKEFPMTASEKFCAQVTSALTHGLSFRRSRGPSLRHGASASF